MPNEKPIKVLVVDDLSDKLLVYRTVLDDPNVQVVCAHSGSEALMLLLEDEFAVILLDVNMPGMDGFETASLIRSRKRCAHTPIIFVTAHSDELHALRGYAYGAVDYILSPIVPEILRTKVRVFTELFRLNRQAREHAATQVEKARAEQDRLAAALESAADFVAETDASGRLLHVNKSGLRMIGLGDTNRPTFPRDLTAILPAWAAQQTEFEGIPAAIRDGIWMGESALRRSDGAELPVSQVILAHKNSTGEVDALSFIARDISQRKRDERKLADSERRYRQLVHSMPAAVYVCDANGRITLFNEAARTLWGRTPEIGKDQWSGAWRSYRPDGSLIAPEDSPMAVTIRERHPMRGEEMIVERSDGTRSHVLPHPEPLFDETGTLVGAINMLVDISDRKKAESAKALLAAIVESTDDAVISETLEGIITSCNPGAERLYGYKGDELVGRSVSILMPEGRRDEEIAILQRISRGERVEHFETVRIAKDGRAINVSLAVSPVRDAEGRVIGASKTARDITERKRAEAELQHYRQDLERLVEERTAELQESHQRLRLSDRLASIGTLAAGLGHDMGNLLLPIRMRLDVLEQTPLSPEVKEDIAAIASSCEYLKRLTHGLRLFALNPDDPKVSGEPSNLAALWVDIAPFLRNALPRDVELEGAFTPDLPSVTMSPHVLTQALYNLVKNAGDALQGSRAGKVTISAATPDQGLLILSVSDNGPGMSEEVRRRCLEPFYTTKARGISTGLGLALVNASLRRVNGSMEIESRPGEGATFRLSLPIVQHTQSPNSPTASAQTARVEIADARMRSFVISLLQSIGVQLTENRNAIEQAPGLLIANGIQEHSGQVAQYLDRAPNGFVIVLAEAPERAHPRSTYLGEKPSVAALRDAIFAVVRPQSPADEGGAR